MCPLFHMFISFVIKQSHKNATLTSHHVGDLDDRIGVGLGEYAFSSSTLDIETEYAQWCDLLPIPLRRVRNESVPPSECDEKLAT